MCSGLFVACNSTTKGSADEGVIEYKTEIVDSNNALGAIAPSLMVLKFKNNLLSAEMKTGMSAVGIRFISDDKKHKFTQLVRILNQKYICSANAKNIRAIFKDTPEYDVKKVDEPKVIAGINCQKAEIYEKGKAKHLFDVYYTDAFKLDKPNWWNEFSEIDGLLMDYRMKRFNFELHFTAKKFEQIHLDSSEFKMNGNYIKITQEELNSYFDALK